jgi:hypothetical protein
MSDRQDRFHLLGFAALQWHLYRYQDLFREIRAIGG